MPARSFREPATIACLFLVLFLGVADNQVLSPLLPAIRAEFGKTSAELGLIFTGYSLAAGLLVLLWGPLSDMSGPRQGILTALLIFGIGSLLSSLSHGLPALVCGRAVTGAGASMLSLNAISYAAGSFPYRRRGWAMGSIVSSYFAALVFGVPVGSWLGDRFGWNAVFSLACATSVSLLAVVYLLLPPLATGRAPMNFRFRLSLSLKDYVGFLFSREHSGALFSSFFASAGAMGFLAFLGVWLHDAFNLSGRDIGLVFLASGAAALVASPVGGAISDRIGKRIQFVGSSMALAFLLLVLPNLHWGAALFLTFGGISMAAAFRQGPMEALVTELVEPQRRGSFIALRNAFSQLGIGLSASMSGVLFQNFGYSAVCILGGGANLLAALLMIALVKRHKL